MVVKLPEDDCTSEDMSPAPSSSSPELLAGYLPPSTTEEARFAISHSQYLNDRPAKTFGTSNPTLMNKPFWKYMIQQHLRDSDDGGAYSARKHFEPGVEIVFETFGEPVWCFQRYGQTKTKLPDGRWILVGGEHEDWYDPDFCIYNGKLLVLCCTVRAVGAVADPVKFVDVVIIQPPRSDQELFTPDCIQIYGYIPCQCVQDDSRPIQTMTY